MGDLEVCLEGLWGSRGLTCAHAVLCNSPSLALSSVQFEQPHTGTSTECKAPGQVLGEKQRWIKSSEGPWAMARMVEHPYPVSGTVPGTLCAFTPIFPTMEGRNYPHFI